MILCVVLILCRAIAMITCIFLSLLHCQSVRWPSPNYFRPADDCCTSFSLYSILRTLGFSFLTSSDTQNSIHWKAKSHYAKKAKKAFRRRQHLHRTLFGVMAPSTVDTHLQFLKRRFKYIFFLVSRSMDHCKLKTIESGAFQAMRNLSVL